MTETAQQRAKRLLSEVSASKIKKTYTPGEVRNILETIANAKDTVTVASDDTCRAPIKLDKVSRGDVFIHKLVGGKVRPWVVLRVSENMVTAVALSSGDSAANMIQARCRLWKGSWIGTAVSQFDMDHAAQEVTRPYTNHAHLSEIENHIAAGMGMRVEKLPLTSLAQIRERLNE